MSGYVIFSILNFQTFQEDSIDLNLIPMFNPVSDHLRIEGYNSPNLGYFGPEAILKSALNPDSGHLLLDSIDFLKTALNSRQG